MTKKAAYFGWLGYGNLGDELCYDVTKRMLGGGVKLVPGVYHDSRDNFDCFICGGGTLVNKSWNWLIKSFIDHGTPVIFLGTGIDEPGFDPYARYTKKDLADISLIFKKASAVYLRGPLSKQYMKTLGIKRAGKVIGDLGQLMSDFYDIKQKKKNEGTFLGVNYGITYGDIYGNKKQFEKEMLKLFKYLNEQKEFRVKYISTWIEDYKYFKTIKSRYNLKNISLPKIAGLQDLAAHISSCDTLVGEKLHFIVAAASYNVPFVAIAYRAKCLDYLKTIDMENMSLRTDERNLADAVICSLGHCLKNEDKIRKKLQKKNIEAKARIGSAFIGVREMIGSL